MYSRTARVSTVRWNLKEAVSESLVRRTEIAYKASATNYMGEGGCQMKGKKFAEVFASLVKTVAIASVSESSDWYNYQTKEPEGLRKIYLIKHEKK